MKRFGGGVLLLLTLYAWWQLQPQDVVHVADQRHALLQLKTVQLSRFEAQEALPSLHLEVDQAIYWQEKKGRLIGIRAQTPQHRIQAQEALYQPHRYRFYAAQLEDETQSLRSEWLNYFPESKLFWAHEGVQWRQAHTKLKAREATVKGQKVQLWGGVTGQYQGQES